jgi:hypothetical protein
VQKDFRRNVEGITLDPHLLFTENDPNTDSAFMAYTDPDPTFQKDTDPDGGKSLQIFFAKNNDIV